MTLPELAALAVEKVPGFERPLKYCDECDDPMEFPGKTRDEYGQTRTCGRCDGAGVLFDGSPAALLMAVELCAVKCGARYQIDDGIVMVTTDKRTGAVASPMEVTPEAIARAALVALLRAHGVEVADEPTASTPETT